MDHIDDPRPDATTADELVAAVLDGEATPAELDVVSNDPMLRARLGEFAAVRSVLATDPGPPVAAPIDLTARRRQRNHQLIGVLGAVAATVLITVGGLSLFRSADTPEVVATGTATDPVTNDSSTGTAAARSSDELVGPAVGSVDATPESTSVDCSSAVVGPDGRWGIVGSSACAPLRLPIVPSQEVVRIVGELLASRGPLVITVGVGTGTSDALPACSWGRREPLGVVTVVDRPTPVVVAVDAFGGVVLFDTTTCSPV